MPNTVPAGHATIKGQMLISCILASSLRAAPHPVWLSGLDKVLPANLEFWPLDIWHSGSRY